MKKRGRIMRDTNNGPGLIGCAGDQFEFQLEGVWKSETAPVINSVVEFDVDDTKKVIAISVISESQLAKEQADKALQAAKETGTVALHQLVSRVGMPVLVATAVLAISWFFLSTMTVQASQYLTAKITFWKLLTILNLGSGGMLQALESGGGNDTGLYGFLVFVSLVGPFVYQIWKDPKAHLGNCLPLLMMLFVVLSFYLGIEDGIKSSQQISSALGGGAQATQMMNGMMAEMMKAAMGAIHVGVGAYLSVLSSLYLAFVGITRFLAAKA
ncbi:hypothetical protein [Undibacterium sp. RuRC25W]|uniref:hypothetical protein n=1 Tax=Undibacterium sp. RuRC25W TaxID=3413047 RepID=UPI003BF130C5